MVTRRYKTLGLETKDTIIQRNYKSQSVSIHTGSLNPDHQRVIQIGTYDACTYNRFDDKRIFAFNEFPSFIKVIKFA